MIIEKMEDRKKPINMIKTELLISSIEQSVSIIIMSPRPMECVNLNAGKNNNTGMYEIIKSCGEKKKMFITIPIKINIVEIYRFMVL